MASNFTIQSFGKSDIGLKRNNNEDVFRELPKEQFFVLADGMGGHNAGEIAAAKAVEYMCSQVQGLFISKSKNHFNLEQLKTHIGTVIENANLWVHHLGLSDPQFQGMGTTVCALLFYKEFVIYSHIGDSRIYKLRNGKIKAMTKDHLITRNLSTPRKVLEKAIGTSIQVGIEIADEVTIPGDIYLMCSDGLTDLVNDEEIEDIISISPDLNRAGNALISLAKNRGGHDNITLLLASVK